MSWQRPSLRPFWDFLLCNAFQSFMYETTACLIDVPTSNTRVWPRERSQHGLQQWGGESTLWNDQLPLGSSRVVIIERIGMQF